MDETICVDNYMRDREILELECRRVMDGLYVPAVNEFLIELAIRRVRLQQLRDLACMGMAADDIRRLVMSSTYYPPHMIATLLKRDVTNFAWEYPAFTQYGRFRILWENFKYRIRNILLRGTNYGYK